MLSKQFCLRFISDFESTLLLKWLIRLANGLNQNVELAGFNFNLVALYEINIRHKENPTAPASSSWAKLFDLHVWTDINVLHYRAPGHVQAL